MVENLAPFSTVVLVAHVAQISSGMTVAGAALFFYARLIHAIVFIFAVPWLRTLAFVAGWVGILLVFLEIVL